MDALIKTLAGRKAVLTRFYGPDHPDTIKVARELAAVRLAAALQAARTAGLDPLDVAAVVKTGRLPEVVAA